MTHNSRSSRRVFTVSLLPYAAGWVPCPVCLGMEAQCAMGDLAITDYWRCVLCAAAVTFARKRGKHAVYDVEKPEDSATFGVPLAVASAFRLGGLDAAKTLLEEGHG